MPKPGFQLRWLSDPHLPLQSRTSVQAGETFGESSCESQKFSTTQALLLYVEIVKARFLPSGEAKGTARIELVVHNSETSPFELTRRIVAACTDELATNQPFSSADQLIPERCFEPPSPTNSLQVLTVTSRPKKVNTRNRTRGSFAFSRSLAFNDLRACGRTYSDQTVKRQ